MCANHFVATPAARAHGTIDQAGRVTIPAEMRKSLGMEPGTAVLLEADGAGVRVRTWEQTVQGIQARFAPYRKSGSSVVEEFLRERREEAARRSVARAVLDASAVLALLFGEPGADRVAELMPAALVSAVNVAEVAGKLLDKGVPEADLADSLAQLRYAVEPFAGEVVMLTASLRPRTRALGLSLGDRACLALGLLRGLPVVTADRGWANLDLGVKVEVIR